MVSSLPQALRRERERKKKEIEVASLAFTRNLGRRRMVIILTW